MSWKIVQQLIRMGMMALGSSVLGDSVADGEAFQGAIGGAISVVSFVWWYLSPMAAAKK